MDRPLTVGVLRRSGLVFALLAVVGGAGAWISSRSHPSPRADRVACVAGEGSAGRELRLTGADLEGASLLLLPAFGNQDALANRLETWTFLYDIAIAGQYAFLANNEGGVSVMNVEDPTAPVVVARLEIPGRVRAVHLREQLAFLALGDSGLGLVDVSQPEQPVFCGHLTDLPGQIWEVASRGRYAYVAAGNAGLHLLDLDIPDQPRLISTLPLAGRVMSLALAGDQLLVGTVDDGYSLFSLRQPESPELLARGTATGNGITDCWLRADLAVLVSAGRIQLLSLADPRRPRPLSVINPSGWAVAIALDGDMLYTVSTRAGIEAFSLANPSRPVRQGFVSVARVVGIASRGEYLLVAGGWDGLITVAKAQLAQGVFDGVEELRRVRALARRHDLLVAAPVAKELILAELSGDEVSVVQRLPLPSPARDLVLEGDRVYLALGEHGLGVLRLSGEPEAMAVEITPLPIPVSVLGVGEGQLLAGSSSIESEGEKRKRHEFALCTLTDPDHPLEIARFQTWATNDILIHQGHAYLAQVQQGVAVYALHGERAPTLLRRIRSPWPEEAFASASRLLRDDNLLYVANGSAGIMVLDIAEPAAPRIVQEIALSGAVVFLVKVGEWFYAGVHMEGLAVLEREAGQLRLLGLMPARLSAEDIVPLESRLLVGNLSGQVFRIPEPSRLAPLAAAENGWRVEIPRSLPAGVYQPLLRSGGVVRELPPVQIPAG